jgi:protein SCO1/2
MTRALLMMTWMAMSAVVLAAGPGTQPVPGKPVELKAGVLSPVMPAPAIRLRGTDGKPIDLERFRGKVVIVAFGFSNCGEVCPITLATLAGARKKLAAEADAVQVIYITVDPERDTAAQMKKYLASFDPTFIGGVGTRAEIDATQKRWGISSKRIEGSGGHYTIGHSSSIYLIDRSGGLRAVMPYGHGVEDFVHDLRILLRT